MSARNRLRKCAFNSVHFGKSFPVEAAEVWPTTSEVKKVNFSPASTRISSCLVLWHHNTLLHHPMTSEAKSLGSRARWSFSLPSMILPDTRGIFTRSYHATSQPKKLKLQTSRAPYITSTETNTRSNNINKVFTASSRERGQKFAPRTATLYHVCWHKTLLQDSLLHNGFCSSISQMVMRADARWWIYPMSLTLMATSGSSGCL